MATRYELWRQDDNGNRYLVDVFADREAAERKASELTDLGHKQTYFVLAREEPPAD